MHAEEEMGGEISQVWASVWKGRVLQQIRKDK